jgi:hypothetical protein
MRSLIEGLPVEIARQISPDWRKNEADYWRKREDLLPQYQGQWIGFADGKVIASGPSPVQVLHAAKESAAHPFVTCVGREREPCHMRRAVFPNDDSYPGEPLPVISAEFRKYPDPPSVNMDHVIADTGADASALPWPDCQRLQLDPADAIPGLMGGVGGSSVPTIVFRAWVHLDRKSCPCRLQADFHGNERILGRDVLNRMDVISRGPSATVIVNPGASDSA